MILDRYVPIVGQSVIDELRWIAEKLHGRRILNINSTATGGGVAEILNRMVPLFQEMGVDARWEVLRGDNRFFAITKTIHNALHGGSAALTEEDVEIYWKTQEKNLKFLNLDADIFFVHDPQPAGLIRQRGKTGGRWIWRCHVDVSAPNRDIWAFVSSIMKDYDASVFSSPSFAKQLPLRQALISPSIDPLSDKNRELEPSYVVSVLQKFGLSKDKPIVTQVSRFDRLKDPVGVVEAYRLVKPYVDCQLVLSGSSAADDPEGAQVLAEVREKAGNDPDIHILGDPPVSDLEVNAIQRASAVVLQKSLKEGFGLTVTEALWKGRPVIGGAVGGIPLQISHKHSGILVRSVEGTAYWLKQLLQSPAYAKQLGENGREHVRDNFLLTRHLRDYMLLFLSLDHADQDIINL